VVTTIVKIGGYLMSVCTEILKQCVLSKILTPVDTDNFDAQVYPHFAVYRRIHESLIPEYTNFASTAQILSRISDEHIRHLTVTHFAVLGLPVPDICSEAKRNAEEELHKWGCLTPRVIAYT
jgi:hypothetical protein